MPRLLCFLIIAALASRSAVAEVQQIKLLNPDDTAAVDAQAIAIMSKHSRVDATLKELPGLFEPGKSGTVSAKNALGLIQFDSKALAVVAQSKAGFAFIPLPSRTNTVKLRPWAKLNIDLANLAPEMRKKQKLTVAWENCFAGHPVRPSGSTVMDDPFGNADPFSNSNLPDIDWRFDSFVMWTLEIEAAEQVVNVPPGEVTLLMSEESFSTATAESAIPFVRFTPMRSLSGKQLMFKAPKLETIKGKLVEDLTLPDWAAGSDHSLMVFLDPAAEKMPEKFDKLFTGLGSAPGGNVLDELARRYASEVGMEYRYELESRAATRVKEDGTLEFTNVPAGKYSLHLLSPSFHAPVPLKRRGQADNPPLTFEVTSQAAPLDIGELERANPPSNVPSSPVKAAASDDPFANFQPPTKASPIQAPPPSEEPLTAEQAEQKIKLALTKRVDADYQGLPLVAALDDLSNQCSVPIWVNSIKLNAINVSEQSPVVATLPRMTLQSALRHILSCVSDELTYTIRDEILLITTKEDAARERLGNEQPPNQAEPDTGDAFVQQWLKNAAATNDQAIDQAALRTALQAHLEKEFDAKQKSRQAELVRLRTLLKQSEDWLSDRQKHRAEIVDKKVNELVANMLSSATTSTTPSVQPGPKNLGDQPSNRDDSKHTLGRDAR